jgi:DHA1 family bicyclomycin/chloramphenicol resistance-like MFS transporter
MTASSPTSPPRRRPGTVEFIAILSMTMALGALGVDVMLPAFGDIRSAFDLPADSTRVAGLVTFYMIGLAVGTLFYGPIADRFGRKRALLLGYIVYGLGAAGAALAPSLELIFFARLVWGLGAAGPRTIALSIVRDVYEGDRMARTMSFVFAVFIVVPIFAPAIGALIIAIAPWQWVFWFCGAFVLVIAAWALLRLPETLAPANRIVLNPADLRRALGIVLTNRQTVGYMLAITFSFGAFVSYLASSELIIGDVFGRPEVFPLVFGGLATCMGAAMLTNARMVERFGVRRLVHRILLLYVAAAAVLVALSLATGGRPPLLVFLGVLAVILAIHASLIPNVNSLAMDPMGEVAGTAAAIIGFVTTGGGALIGTVIDRSIAGTVTPLAVGFLFSSVAGLAIVLWTERGRLQVTNGTRTRPDPLGLRTGPPHA